MFDSGEAILKPAGESVMRKVAAILAGHPQLKIHVIGHTDNVPIRRSPQPVRQQLGTFHCPCLAAVHFLTEKAGVDPRRVGAVGYGEYRPLPTMRPPREEPGTDALPSTILPDELAGADTVPAVKPGTSTNSPPRPPN